MSVEDYCAYMGTLVGVEPIFEYTPQAHTPLWPDVTYMHQVLGRTRVHWRDGFRRMIEARSVVVGRAEEQLEMAIHERASSAMRSSSISADASASNAEIPEGRAPPSKEEA